VDTGIVFLPPRSPGTGGKRFAGRIEDGKKKKTSLAECRRLVPRPTVNLTAEIAGANPFFNPPKPPAPGVGLTSGKLLSFYKKK